MTTTRAVAPPLSTQQRAQAAKVKGHLGIYSQAVHGNTMYDYQLAWEEALNYGDRIAIVCPPDTYKSTTVQHWLEREIGHDQETTNLWLMNAGDQSEKRVFAVSATLENNPVFRLAFPEVKPNKSAGWSKQALYVERQTDSPDPTLMGCGWNGPYQGFHFRNMILDDLTNQEDVKSPATMSLQEEKLTGVIRDRLVDGGRFIAIFTRWGENDLYRIYKRMGFRIVEMPVLSDRYANGYSISDRFTPAKIAELRRDKGEALFQMTYMCNPSAASGQIVSREHIRHWSMDSLPKEPMQVFIGVDPGLGASAGDYSALAVVGICLPSRVMYVLDVIAGRWLVPDFEKEIVRQAKRVAGLRAIGVETIAFQRSLVQYLKRNHHLPLVELPYRTRRQALHKVVGIDKDKEGRAAYLDQLFMSGRLYLPPEDMIPLCDGVDLATEICSIGPANKLHDDRPDAIVFAAALADSMFTRLPRVSIKAW